MTNSLKPEIVKNSYEPRVGLFLIRDRAVQVDTYSPGDVLRHIMTWHLHDKSLALARYYNVAVIKIRHAEELIPEALDPNEDVLNGGRTSTGEYTPYLPIPQKTKFVVGHTNSGLPTFKTKEQILKHPQLPDYLQNSLGGLALYDGWRPEMDDFLPFLPGRPADLQEFQANLRAGSGYLGMIDNPSSIPLDY